MEERLWDLANGIAAFSVLQTIAFLYALGKPEFSKMLKSQPPLLIASSILLSTVIYLIPLFYIGWWSNVEIADVNQEIWDWFNGARVALVVLMSGICALAYARLRWSSSE